MTTDGSSLSNNGRCAIIRPLPWSGIEVVITGLTRNQLVGFTGTWVRIPPAPHELSTCIIAGAFPIVCGAGWDPPVRSICVQPPWSGVCTCFALTNAGRLPLALPTGESLPLFARSAKNETPQTGCFRFWRNERVGFGPTCPRGKQAECQHSVLSDEAGNEASLLARKGE